MYKSFVLLLTGLLSLSPTRALIEDLYQLENECYTDCHRNYENDLLNLKACQKGCDYKLHDENCDYQCKSYSADEEIRSSCLSSCNINNNNMENSQSLILIRLRPNPQVSFSPTDRDFIQFVNDIVHRMQQNTKQYGGNTLGQKIRLSSWLMILILLLLSIVLWRMIILLCCHRPKHHVLSIRAQEFVFEKTNFEESQKLKAEYA